MILTSKQYYFYLGLFLFYWNLASEKTFDVLSKFCISKTVPFCLGTIVRTLSLPSQLAKPKSCSSILEIRTVLTWSLMAKRSYIFAEFYIKKVGKLEKVTGILGRNGSGKNMFMRILVRRDLQPKNKKIRSNAKMLFKTFVPKTSIIGYLPNIHFTKELKINLVFSYLMFRGRPLSTILKVFKKLTQYKNIKIFILWQVRVIEAYFNTYVRGKK